LIKIKQTGKYIVCFLEKNQTGNVKILKMSCGINSIRKCWKWK